MLNNSIGKFLVTIIFLTWCAVILAIFGYYTGSNNHMQGAFLHEIMVLLPEKIIDFPFTRLLLSTLISFIGMVFYGVSSLSLGMKLTAPFLRMNDRTNSDTHHQMGIHYSTYFLIGNAAFSLVLLILASVLHLSPILSLVILSLGFLSGIGHLRKSFFPSVHMPDRQEKIVTFLSIAILAVTLFQSSARLSYDASAIYFSNAKLTALEQKAGYFMKDTFVVSVFHSVIPFSAVIQVFGDQSARLITWLFGIVNIVIVLAIAEYVGTSARSRRTLLILILTTTAFLDLIGDGKVDLISSAYAICAIYWLIARKKIPNQSPFQYILSGGLIGFACILRPYNAFLLGVFVLVHLIQNLIKGRVSIRNAIRQTIWLAVGAIGLAIYHLLINKIILGSPIAFWSNLSTINPVDGPWDYDPKKIWMERLLYPIIVTFKNSPSSLGSITPLMLIFLPALAIKNIRKSITLPKELIQLSYSAGITLYAWIFLFFTIAEIRYVMFLWFILFIPIAEVAVGIFRTEIVLIRNVTKGFVILLLGFILVRAIYISIVKYAPLDAEGNPECVDDILCNHYSALNEIAGKNERVLSLSAFRYYLRTDLFACSTTVDEYSILKNLSYKDTEAFWEETYRMGYKYIAFEKDYGTRHLNFSTEPFENPPVWVKLIPIITTSEELQIVAYKLDVIDPPVNVNTSCIQDESGIWYLQKQQ